MVAEMRQGVRAKQRLSAQDMVDLKRLVALCNAREHLLMRLDYNMLDVSGLPTSDLFLYYDQGQLVGCLLLDRYHSDMKEVTVAVDPAFRRRGIFRELLAAARAECLSRGIRRLLFTCEQASQSGQAAIKASHAGREFAEHRMILHAFQPRFQYDDRLLVREAEESDLEKLALILADDFDNDQERAFAHVVRAWQRPNQRFFIATYGGEEVGCAEPVGTLRLEDMPEEVGIYGFFVRPAYRGRGHGRQLLEETIAISRAESQKRIMLEVDTNNFTALNLYHSLGFVIERTYEYYGLDLL